MCAQMRAAELLTRDSGFAAGSRQSLHRAQITIDQECASVRVLSDDDVVVGMGCVIGDGGWCFHINDMAVLAEHQRRMFGDALLM